jgi:hypothetical protein
MQAFIMSEIQNPPKDDGNTDLLNVLNKAQMFKIVVDKVNKKVQEGIRVTKTAYSGFSYRDKSAVPRPKKKEQMFTMTEIGIHDD